MTQTPAAPAARARLLRTALRSPSALTGGVLVLLVVLCALFAPLLAPFDPVAYNPADRLQGPSLEHPLGTDIYGRDTFSRVLFGARTSLAVAAISITLALLAGGTAGALAGFFRGNVDVVVMRLSDILLAFPAVLLAIALLAFLGGGFWNLTLAIAVVYSAPFARVARASVLRVREEAYVEASHALGNSPWRILFRHVLPNAASPLIVEVSLRLAFAILAEASLSYLGLGTQPPAPSWGQMIADGRQLLETSPWISIGPGLAITLTVLGFNLLGDGLRDLLDPRLRRQ
ncbi:Glutathione transport system permease protein GsiD [Calidithermus terrae]|uniref:Glutathione transport system permease protein GsiD n=1 Tax=Calidithermus terrae TaxID=1408545 RepID=A0A399ETU2_9DEIN|nr:ABC transporter permease [Calidithermus terrae]RIH86499.1 Glutathione transport system permease protein GsiD [Calidithermus terrae]